MYFLGIDKAKFRHPVTPGDRLDLEVTIVHHRSNVWKLRGEATVDGTLCARASSWPASSIAHGERCVTSRVHPTAIVDRRAELATGRRRSARTRSSRRASCSARARRFTRTPSSADRRSRRGQRRPSVRGHRRRAAGEDATRAGPARLEIGERNVFREHVTVHRGTDGRTTRIGSNNLFMVGAHVAHDVVVGSHCVFANAVQLAGHAVVEDWVTFGGLRGVAQFVRVGESAFVAAGAVCERDVPPFVIVQGDRARVRALNVVGLQRRGVPRGEHRRARARHSRAVDVASPASREALRALDGGDRPLRAPPRRGPAPSSCMIAIWSARASSCCRRGCRRTRDRTRRPRRPRPRAGLLRLDLLQPSDALLDVAEDGMRRAARWK